MSGNTKHKKYEKDRGGVGWFQKEKMDESNNDGSEAQPK